MNNFGLMLDVLRMFLQNANNVIREDNDGSVVTIKDFVPNYIEAVQSLANGSDRPSAGAFMYEILEAIKMLEDFDYNADEVRELITTASKVARSMVLKTTPRTVAEPIRVDDNDDERNW